jgi:membrane-bound lytic murein transglycosylase D
VGKQVYASLYDVLNSPEADDEPQVIAANYTENSSPINIPESHRVKEGQTLLMVANQYGIEVQDLIVYKNLKVTEVVPGQYLRLKNETSAVKTKSVRSGYVTYIVKAGDTLTKIADKFSGTSISKIKALNGLKRSAVAPGMKLKINKG